MLVRAEEERAQTVCIYVGRIATEKADHRQCRLLCVRRERPGSGSATEKCDEFPSLHGGFPVQRATPGM
jgi:hypothetical protein